MNPSAMLETVREQLAVDMNCSPADLMTDGFHFRAAADLPGRRPFPRGKRHFEMLSMGGDSVVVSATPDILPYVRGQLSGASRDDAFSMPFVCGCSLYYLPDLPHLPVLEPPVGYSFRWYEQKEIPRLYQHDCFHMALGYDTAHPRPDVLALAACRGKEIAGVAGASIDCDHLWQVGIDVVPGHRGNGIAAYLINALTREILSREKIPYYGTSSANIASQRVAHRSGYAAAWICAYRGRFDGVMTGATG